jgi:prepilin-type N-terminal cleavage/methylation domain-containing protein
MTKSIQKNQKGFTLIELLVVVAIISILALIVILALNPIEMSRKSRDSRRLSDLSTLRKAIDLSLADGKSLATTAKAWITVNPSTSVLTFGANGSNPGTDISKYISAVPEDPVHDTSGTTQAIVNGTPCTASPAVDKSAMIYEFSSDGNTYILRSRVESLDNCNAIMNDGNSGTVYYELGTTPLLHW